MSTALLGTTRWRSIGGGREVGVGLGLALGWGGATEVFWELGEAGLRDICAMASVGDEVVAVEGPPCSDFKDHMFLLFFWE